MSNRGGGLDFSQGHFVDPMASLQQTLGAGGMFAKTLSSMQQFDQDQQKMDMMRADRERQAKLDAEHAAEKAAAAAEKKIIAGASAALANKSVNMAYGNDMFQADVDAKKDKFLVNKSDAELGFKGKTYADILKGVDTSKFNEDQMAEHQQFLLADKDTTAKYTAGNKLALQTRLNKAAGMSDADAQASAAKSLGLSIDMASGLTKSDNLALEFGKRVESLKDDALYAQTDVQALRDYQNSDAYKAYVAKYGDVQQIDTSIQTAMKANSEAQKLRHDKIAERTAALAGLADGAEKDQINTEIELLKLQMQNADSPSSRAYAKASLGGSKDPKASYRSDVDEVLRGYMTKYNAAPADVKIQMRDMAYTLRDKQYSKEQIGMALSSMVDVTKGDKDTPDVYSLNKGVNNMLAQKPDTSAFDARYAGSDGEAEMSVLIANEKRKDALNVKLQEAIASGSGKAGQAKAAAIRKEIADLGRTPMQSAHDAAYLAGKDFMRDFNVGGYNDEQSKGSLTPSEVLRQRAASPKGIGAPGAGGVDRIGETIAGSKPISNTYSSNVKAFQLDPKYNSLDSAGRQKILIDSSINLIKKEEGQNGKGRYVPYDDKQIDKNGKVIDVQKTIGHGIHLNEFLAATPQLGGKFDPNNKSHQAMFDKYEEKRLNDTVIIGRNQAAALGLPAEAIPILASMAHQSGAGWMSKWPNLVKSLKEQDYDSALDIVDKSLWHKKQTPERAERFMGMISAAKEMKDKRLASGSDWKYAPDEKYSKYLGAADDIVEDSKKTEELSTAAIQKELQQKIAEQNKETNRTNKEYEASNMLLHPITTFQVGQENRDSRMQANMLNNQLAVINKQSELDTKVSELNRLKIAARSSKKASDRVAIDNAEYQIQLLKNQIAAYKIGSK